MARPKSEVLTDNELEIMNILWGQSPLSVTDVLDRLKRRPKPAYTSLMTTMQSMERKKYLRHVQEGKAYLYLPALVQSKYRKLEVERIANRVFGGNPMDLAVSLVKSERLIKENIDFLKKMLEKL